MPAAISGGSTAQSTGGAPKRDVRETSPHSLGRGEGSGEIRAAFDVGRGSAERWARLLPVVRREGFKLKESGLRLDRRGNWLE